jgi:hypothetical protein
MPSPRFALLAFATLALSGTAVPAVAVDPVTTPTMEITIDYVTGGHYVCAHGALHGGIPAIAPEWTFTVTGTRSDGTPITHQKPLSQLGFDYCWTVKKMGSPYGSYTVELAYVGFGESTDDDVPLSIAGVGLWRPEGDNSVAMKH